MHADFNTPLWRKLRAHLLLRVETHTRRLKVRKVSAEETEELRGRIHELERLIALEGFSSDEIETTPTATGTER